MGSFCQYCLPTLTSWFLVMRAKQGQNNLCRLFTLPLKVFFCLVPWICLRYMAHMVSLWCSIPNTGVFRHSVIEVDQCVKGCFCGCFTRDLLYWNNTDFFSHSPRGHKSHTGLGKTGLPLQHQGGSFQFCQAPMTSGAPRLGLPHLSIFFSLQWLILVVVFDVYKDGTWASLIITQNKSQDSWAAFLLSYEVTFAIWTISWHLRQFMLLWDATGFNNIYSFLRLGIQDQAWSGLLLGTCLPASFLDRE